MPVRDKAVYRLLEDIIGVRTFDGRTGEPGFGDPMTAAAYSYAHRGVQAMYVRMVESVDWSRVLIEATSRCIQLGHDHERTESFLTVCGESVRCAMLSRDWAGTRDWTTWVEPAITPPITDWPRAIVKAFPWRNRRRPTQRTTQ